MNTPIPQRSSYKVRLHFGKFEMKNSVTNCEAYSSLDTVKSDHRTITEQVKLSLRIKYEDQKTSAIGLEDL